MFETEAGFAETKMLIDCNGDYSKKQDYKKGWQDGATFGYNKAKEEGKVVVEHFEAYGQCRDSRRIAALEAENEELKKECGRCIYTDSPCTLADYGKDEHGYCDHFKDVFDENTELKKINAELKRIYARSASDAAMYAHGARKAKELIRQLCLMVRELNNPNVQLTNVDYSLKEAEQFLKEVKENE